MAKNKAKQVMKTINIQTRSITICKQQTMMQIDNLELSDEQKRCMLSTTTRSKYSLLGQNLEATTPLPAAAHEAAPPARGTAGAMRADAGVRAAPFFAS